MAEHPEIKTVVLSCDIAGEFRFAAVAGNGETISTSSEGYTHRVDALAAAVALFPDAAIVDETQAASD